MDMEETETGSGDAVNGVDRILVGMGVAALALLPTYIMLMAKPARLADFLQPDSAPRSKPPFLGPGLFFVASLLFVLMIATLTLSGVKTPSPERIEAAQTTGGAAYSIGTGIGYTLAALEDKLSSGDFWNAVAVAMPVFGYAVVLAFGLWGLIRLTTKEWTAAHAVGAALYMVGGLMTGTSLIAGLTVLMGYMVGTLLAGVVMLLGLLGVLCLTSVQAYAFAKAKGADDGARLGLASTAVPILVVLIFSGFAILSTMVGDGLAPAPVETTEKS